MSDDEDYMSDKFLLSSEKDVPPSLIHRHSDRREHALMKRKAETELKMKEQNKPIRVVEAEKREEGLSSAITSTNKGLYSYTELDIYRNKYKINCIRKYYIKSNFVKKIDLDH